MQPIKLGKGGLKCLIRCLKAFFESLQPVEKPVGAHIQIPHSASLEAKTDELFSRSRSRQVGVT